MLYVKVNFHLNCGIFGDVYIVTESESTILEHLKNIFKDKISSYSYQVLTFTGNVEF